MVVSCIYGYTNSERVMTAIHGFVIDIWVYSIVKE